jgi:hypothetical protein
MATMARSDWECFMRHKHMVIWSYSFHSLNTSLLLDSFIAKRDLQPKYGSLRLEMTYA